MAGTRQHGYFPEKMVAVFWASPMCTRDGGLRSWTGTNPLACTLKKNPKKIGDPANKWLLTVDISEVESEQQHREH